MIHKLFVIFFLFLISTGSTGYCESGSTLFDNGISEFQRGRYQDAVFWFTKLIEKEPFNAKAYKNRGVARLSLQKYDMAIEDLNSALNPDPQLDDITGNLGPAWHYKEEYKKAMEDFNSALNLDPDLEGIHSNIGVAWYYAREYEKAIAEYDKEIKKHPENYSAFFNRALSWVELKEYQKALNDLTSVLTIKPDEYWAIAYQGDIYSEINNLVAARESYLGAMALNTGNKYAKEKLLLLDARVSSPMKTEPPELFTAQPGDVETATSSPAPETESASTRTIETHEPPETPAILAGTMEAQLTQKTKSTAYSPEKKSVKSRTMAQSADALSAEVLPVQEPTAIKPSPPAVPTETQSTSTEKERIEPPKFTIQLGAFLNSDNAEDLIHTLHEKGYETRVVHLHDKKNRQWTLVRSGTFQTNELAKETLEKIKTDLNIQAVIRPIGKF